MQDRDRPVRNGPERDRPERDRPERGGPERGGPVRERRPEVYRGSRFWIVAALAAALIIGVGYYFWAVNQQPSVVSDDGGELMAPAEVEAEILDESEIAPQPDPAPGE